MIQRMRTWWQARTGEDDTPFDGESSAWLISLFVHLGIFVILTIIGLTLKTDHFDLTLVTEDPVEEEELDIAQEFYFSEEQVDQIGANSMNGELAALAQAPIEAPESVIPTPEIKAEVSEVQINPVVAVATGPNLSNHLLVKGSAVGHGTTGAMGAIDRITHEIKLSLERNPTLVVWIFDKSGSLKDQRDQINERFNRVYHELGVIEESGHEAFDHEDTPLLTSIVAFGQSVEVMTPPTDDLEKVKASVASIENDSSGVERVFSSIHEAAEKYKTFRIQEPRRNVMLITFTDEAGDDQQGLDATVDLCRKFEMPCYVVGVPAPFGRKEVEIKYSDPNPEYDQTTQWIPVHQGPESFMPERIKLRFTANRRDRDEAIDSGFGPYALTRLCYETGGIYFAVHPNRNAQGNVSRGDTANLSAHMEQFFDPGIMRKYRPDYVSTEEYQRLLTENQARLALVQAADLSWATPLENPELRFPVASEAELANRLTNAQQKAAKLEPKVMRIYETLALGEKDRPKLETLRWEAGYDLAMGRAAAVLARISSYNAMLAKAKQGMKFQNPKNDTWVLRPSNEITVGSQLEKLAEKGRMYLTRVVEEHPDTPWAYLAQKELEEPIGWAWSESYTGVMERRQGVGNGNGNAMPRDDMRRNMMKKPKKKRTPNL